ncbi:MAG: hypothetical protein U0263_39750 [Polyangiaceae bacterium]
MNSRMDLDEYLADVDGKQVVLIERSAAPRRASSGPPRAPAG